jgi:hypothetical protein
MVRLRRSTAEEWDSRFLPTMIKASTAAVAHLSQFLVSTAASSTKALQW